MEPEVRAVFHAFGNCAAIPRVQGAGKLTKPGVNDETDLAADIIRFVVAVKTQVRSRCREYSEGRL
jgi:hypothetical protein